MEVIVVGITNNAQRLGEYAPFPDARFDAPASGQQYAAFIAETVKPLIDKRYRTRRDRHGTGIAGSSMGGLISLYTGFTYPETFGFVAAFSPSLSVGGGRIFDWLAAHRDPTVRVYVDMGSLEGSPAADGGPHQAVKDATRLARQLAAQGNTIQLHIERGAGHQESAWRRRFPPVLRWFLTVADATDASEGPAPAIPDKAP